MTKKAKTIFDNLVKTINAQSVSGFVRHHLFSDGVDIPCFKWSFLNQYATFMAGTRDARGMKQWNTAGRKVKKGSHPFYIFVPMLYPKPKKEADNAVEENDETDEASDRTLTGFKAMPVFRVEDTEGAPLDYERKLQVLDVDSLPLIDVARALGVTVEAGLTFDYAGSYRNINKKITMGTTDPVVFLHELSHAVDHALANRNNDYAFGEVVAELSAAFLASLYDVPVDIPNTKAYIDAWKGKGHIVFKMMDAMKRVEEIYLFIEQSKKKKHKASKQDKKPPKRYPAKSKPENAAVAVRETV